MNPEHPVSTTSASSTAVSLLSGWVHWFFSLENRYLAPMFITCILAAAQWSFGVLESYARTVLAIVTALVIELVVGRLYCGQWPHLASAYVSGISVGILVRSPAMWPYATLPENLNLLKSLTFSFFACILPITAHTH